MAMTGKAANRISEKLNISKIPLNTPMFYELSKEQDWVEKLLRELNEKADTLPPEEYLEKTNLNIELEITKCFKSEYGEYILIKGHLNTQYKTVCVRTLAEMDETLDLNFSVACLSQKFEDDEEFSEQLEIFEKDTLYELYFYKKGHVDLFEILHEIIYLNINQYPVKDGDTPLHWANPDYDTKQ